MKKRILSIVLTICMVFMFLPTTVFAANEDATALQNLLNSGGTVTLSKDYTIDSTLNVTTNVTLDLNGHVIKMTGSGSVIYVKSDANLTMTDSNKTATHTDSDLPAGGVITGGNTTQNGGGVYVSSGCSMTMTGGTIENCSATSGGGVYVYDSGTFTMEGGTIENCSAASGGGVYVAQSTFTMEGGTINNCESRSGGGGGIYVPGGTFTMGGGTINNCESRSGGGGLCILASGSGSLSTFTMTGGIIENCTSKNVSGSAAIYVSNSNILANGGIVKGMVYLQPNSTIQTTSSSSYTMFYDKVTNNGTISGGIYYGGIQGSSDTVSGTYHTVSFDSNGGSGSIPTQWYVNTSSATALQPADPTKDGFVFAGWYNGDAKYDFTQPVTSNITLTAKWVTTNVSTEAELKETLNAGATSIKLVSDITLSSTLDLTDKNITLDINGYVLTGNIQLADSSASPQSILTLIDSRPTATHSDSSLPVGGVVKGDITLTRESGSVSHLYANGGTVTGQTSLPSYAGGIFCTSDTPTAFTGYVGNYGEIHGGIFYGSIKESCIKEKTVTFINGSSRYALEVVADSNKVVAPISTPLKAGYDFDGWYNGDKKYTFGSTISESITLTAKFSNPKDYNISYDLNGGTATNPETYNVESDAITLNNPVKTGYTFTGWSGTDLTGENNMNVTIAKGSTGDRTYTAHFSQNSYTVTFDTVGGNETISDKTDVKWTDTMLDGITAPTRDGWEFTGWKCGDKTVNANTKYSDLAANDTAASVTLVAQWKDIQKPVITRLENGKTYCDDVDFTVSDNDGIASVKAGDEVLTVGTNGKYTLAKGVGTVTVVVTDNTGNTAQVSVTINDGHTGGTATCVAKAVCEYCGEEYGELDSNNHDLENTPAKAATDTATGNKEYWHCKDCGKYFADEKGTNEIKLDDTIIAVNAWGQTVLRLQATAFQTSVKLKWNAVPEADGYVIFWNKCGSKKAFKQVKEIKSGKTLTWTHKKLKKSSWNRYIVRAYKVINGKKSFIKTSNQIHLVTKGGKYTNVKKLKANVSSVTLKNGKTKALKITQTYVEKNKKTTPHMSPLTYTTSDKKVATVTKKGVIKAKGKGSCYIYITAYSGVYTRVKVTIK